MTTFLEFDYLLEYSETPFLPMSVYCIIKDRDEQPNEEIHRYEADTWKGPEPWNFCPCGDSVGHPLSTWICSSIWKLLKPHTIGIFMEASLCRHDCLLTPFSVSLPSPKILLMASPQPGAIQGPSSSHLIRTKKATVSEKITRDLEALHQYPCSQGF